MHLEARRIDWIVRSKGQGSSHGGTRRAKKFTVCGHVRTTGHSVMRVQVWAELRSKLGWRSPSDQISSRRAVAHLTVRCKNSF